MTDGFLKNKKTCVVRYVDLTNCPEILQNLIYSVHSGILIPAELISDPDYDIIK